MSHITRNFGDVLDLAQGKRKLRRNAQGVVIGSDPNTSSILPPGTGTQLPPNTPESTVEQIVQNPPDKSAEEIAKIFDPARFQAIKDVLGEVPKFDPRPVAPALEKFRPQALQPLSPDFYQSQKAQLKEQLRQEFFGQLGTAQQTVASESAAGRLGSGVGRRLLEEAVTRPFLEEAINIDQGILQAQLQERQRVMELNSQESNRFNEIVSNAMGLDSQNELKAYEVWGTLKSQYDALAADIERGEREGATEAEIATMNRDAQVFIAGLDAWSTARGQDIQQRIEEAKLALGWDELEEDKNRTLIDMIYKIKLDPPAERAAIEKVLSGEGVNIGALYDSKRPPPAEATIDGPSLGLPGNVQPGTVATGYDGQQYIAQDGGGHATSWVLLRR